MSKYLFTRPVKIIFSSIPASWLPAIEFTSVSHLTIRLPVDRSTLILDDFGLNSRLSNNNCWSSIWMRHINTWLMLVYISKIWPHSRPKSSSRPSLCHAWRRERASEVDYHVPRATMLLASTHDNLTECHGTREWWTHHAAGSRSPAIVTLQQGETFNEQNFRKWLVNDFYLNCFLE